MLAQKYPSQRLAYPFFVSMAIFFLLQITYGLTIALQQVDPYFLQGIMNFNVNRSTHINLAIIWVLTGIIATILYVGPLLGGRDIKHAWLARLLLIVIWANVLWTAVALRLGQIGIAGWAFGQPWIQSGLEYLETGFATKIFLWIGFIIVAYLILGTFPNIRKWSEIHWALAIGMLGLVVMWLFGMFFIPDLDLQEYFRWFVVHYWVEGIWEILYVGLVGFLLYTVFGGDLKTVGYMGFWGVLLVLLTGLIGNGHHYFWIGTPAFWQFWGSIFSALEPLPIILGVWHVMSHQKPVAKPVANKVAFYFIFASALFELVGAGILGLTQTFSITNVWEHGTWITPAHAHLAFFGTFGMLVLGAAYAIVPLVKGIRQADDHLSKVAFWIIFSAILGMMMSFGLGGTVQVYIYRILGLDWFGAEVRPAMQLWKDVLFSFGLVFATGVVIFAFDLFTLKEREETLELAVPKTGSGQKPISIFESATWF